jgi:hypothetical protein
MASGEVGVVREIESGGVVIKTAEEQMRGNRAQEALGIAQE